MSARGITSRQADCLAFIMEREAEGLTCPSYDEIADHLGLQSRSSAYRLVHVLVQRGRLVRADRCARSLRAVTAGLTLSESLSKDLRRLFAGRTDQIEAAIRQCVLVEGARP